MEFLCTQLRDRVGHQQLINADSFEPWLTTCTQIAGASQAGLVYTVSWLCVHHHLLRSVLEHSCSYCLASHVMMNSRRNGRTVSPESRHVASLAVIHTVPDLQQANIRMAMGSLAFDGQAS